MKPLLSAVATVFLVCALTATASSTQDSPGASSKIIVSEEQPRLENKPAEGYTVIEESQNQIEIDERPAVLVFVDGQVVTFDVPPALVNGRTLVPLRAIFETLGAEVSWDQPTQMVLAKWADGDISLQIGADTATVRGKTQKLDVPAQLIGGRTMVPLRFVSEALGAEVGWYRQSQSISINTPTALVAATVENVLAGDRLTVVFDSGVKDTVQLNSARTPKEGEDFGVEALTFSRERLTGKRIRLEVDSRSPSGDLWARVYLQDGTLYDALLVDEGYATWGRYRDGLITHLDLAALSARRGLWHIWQSDQATDQQIRERTIRAMYIRQMNRYQEIAAKYGVEQAKPHHPDKMLLNNGALEMNITPVYAIVSVTPDSRGQCPADSPIKATRSSLGAFFLTPSSQEYIKTAAIECYPTEIDALRQGYQPTP